MSEEYDLEVQLCDNGKMSDGNPCTGSAHARGKHLKCTDPSHVIPIEDGRFVFDTGLDYGTLYIEPDSMKLSSLVITDYGRQMKAKAKEAMEVNDEEDNRLGG